MVKVDCKRREWWAARRSDTILTTYLTTPMDDPGTFPRRQAPVSRHRDYVTAYFFGKHAWNVRADGW